jgi:SNF2 family DNA or RNA helicase
VIVFYTVPWSLEPVEQGIARLWRQGQKNKVMDYYLLVENTVDVTVYERVQSRKGLHTRVMEALL